MASQSMEMPTRKHPTLYDVGWWVVFAIVFVSLLLFAFYARAGSLVVLGGTQAPNDSWTSGHEYSTLGVGLYRSYYTNDYIEFEGGIVYQRYMNGTSGNFLGLDIMLTTTGTFYIGANAGFGLIHPRQFQDVGDIPCALGGRFGPLVGFNASDTLAIELRIDHLSAFTPHDKGRNHLVVALKWRF